MRNSRLNFTVRARVPTAGSSRLGSQQHPERTVEGPPTWGPTRRRPGTVQRDPLSAEGEIRCPHTGRLACPLSGVVLAAMWRLVGHGEKRALGTVEITTEGRPGAFGGSPSISAPLIYTLRQMNRIFSIYVRSPIQ
jgi:hypothetical protein